jgi:hypothetical protein
LISVVFLFFLDLFLKHRLLALLPTIVAIHWDAYKIIVGFQFLIITLLPFFIEMLQYGWLWSGHMIIKEMFHIPMKLKSEFAHASMTTSDVNNQWRTKFHWGMKALTEVHFQWSAISLGYENVDRPTFSTWSAVHWKCTSVNAFISQMQLKKNAFNS